MHLANVVVPSTSEINPRMHVTATALGVTISIIGHHSGVDGIYTRMNLEVTFHPNGNGIYIMCSFLWRYIWLLFVGCLNWISIIQGGMDIAGKGLWSHAPADVTESASGLTSNTEKKTSNTSQRNQKGISLFKVYMGLIMIIKDTIPRVTTIFPMTCWSAFGHRFLNYIAFTRNWFFHPDFTEGTIIWTKSPVFRFRADTKKSRVVKQQTWNLRNQQQTLLTWPAYTGEPPEIQPESRWPVLGAVSKSKY